MVRWFSSEPRSISLSESLVQTHRVEVSVAQDIPILFPPFTAFHQGLLPHPFDGGAILAFWAG